MKTRFLIVSLIAVSSSITYAEIATDTQTLTLTVPLVALIDVEDISPSFTFDPPTNAGDGFSGDLGSELNNQPAFAISSNNNDAKMTITLTQQLTGVSLKVKQLAGKSGCFSTARTLSTSATSSTTCSIGMFKTDAGKFEITANSALAAGDMIPHGEYTTNIIYTLTQN